MSNPICSLVDTLLARMLTCAAGLLLASASTVADATTFMLAPRDLGGGFSLSGSISTDGTVGDLAAANITGWSIEVLSISDTFFTPANTVNRSSSLSVAGGQLLVPTSPDGVADGGSLAFGAGLRFRVSMADFTGPGVPGGVASYVVGGGFDTQLLGQPDGINYVAAVANPAGGNQFDLVPQLFSGGAVLSGTVTTAGQTGPVDITDWNIRLRESMSWVFDPTNSRVLYAFGLATDGRELTVSPLDANADPGNFTIGAFNGFDLNGVLLADFTNDPTGEAGYASPLTLQLINGLPLNPDGNVVVAMVPAPASPVLALLGIGLIAAARRQRQASRRDPL